jgi:hypothetical protein
VLAVVCSWLFIMPALEFVSDAEKMAWFFIGLVIGLWFVDMVLPSRGWLFCLAGVFCLVCVRPVSAQSATTLPSITDIESPYCYVLYWPGSGVAGQNYVSDSNIGASSGASWEAFGQPGTPVGLFGNSLYDPWAPTVGSTGINPAVLANVSGNGSPYGTPVHVWNFAFSGSVSSPSGFLENGYQPFVVDFALADYGLYYQGGVVLLRGPSFLATTSGSGSSESFGYSVTDEFESTLEVTYFKGSSVVQVSQLADSYSGLVYLSGTNSVALNAGLASQFVNVLTFASGSASNPGVPSPALMWGGLKATANQLTVAGAFPSSFCGLVQISGIPFVPSVATTQASSTQPATTAPTTQGSLFSWVSSAFFGNTSPSGVPSNQLAPMDSGGVVSMVQSQTILGDLNRLVFGAATQPTEGVTVSLPDASSDSTAAADISSAVEFFFPGAFDPQTFETQNSNWPNGVDEWTTGVASSIIGVANPGVVIITAFQKWAAFKAQYSLFFTVAQVVVTGVFVWNVLLGFVRLFCWSLSINADEVLSYLYLDFEQMRFENDAAEGPASEFDETMQGDEDLLGVED